jgi:hypothetical protein
MFHKSSKGGKAFFMISKPGRINDIHNHPMDSQAFYTFLHIAIPHANFCTRMSWCY